MKGKLRPLLLRAIVAVALSSLPALPLLLLLWAFGPLDTDVVNPPCALVSRAAASDVCNSSLTPPQLRSAGQRRPEVANCRSRGGRFAATLLLAPSSGRDGGERTCLLVLVSSSAASERSRQAIRLSYGTVRREGNCTVRTVFVVGRSPNAAVEKALRAESQRQGDIVQFDFVDSYRNLTLKTVMALRWATEAYDCGRPPAYMLRTDEDVLVNYDRLVDYLTSLGGGSVADDDERRSLYAGHVWRGAQPRRDPRHRYYVSRAEYAANSYPTYVGGPCYVLSANAARQIVAQAPGAPYVTMEDVFVGLCAQRGGLNATAVIGFGRDTPGRYDYCQLQGVIAQHKIGDFWKQRYWRDRQAALRRNGRAAC